MGAINNLDTVQLHWKIWLWPPESWQDGESMVPALSGWHGTLPIRLVLQWTTHAKVDDRGLAAARTTSLQTAMAICFSTVRTVSCGELAA